MKTAWQNLIPLLFLTVTSPLNAQVSFTPLGDLPGGNVFSRAFGSLDDGSTVVGNSDSPGGREVFVWTESGGMIGVGDLPGGELSSRVRGISADGSVIAGWGTSALGTEAFSWTQIGGMIGHGDLPGGDFESRFNGISVDGSIMFGWGTSASGREAMTWTQATGMVGFGDLPGGDFESRFNSISGDSTILVGFGNSVDGQEAVYWTQSSGMVGLGDLAGGDVRSNANRISSDGSTIVGWGTNELGRQAMYWTQADGMVGLGNLGDSDFNSVARGVNENGTLIVGWGTTADGQEAAFWDENRQVHNLQDYLVANGVDNLDGWQLFDAWAITPDGNTIVGSGINPEGFEEAWVVRFNDSPVTSDRLAISDDGSDRVYDYEPIDGFSLGDMPLASGNNAPRGIASDANGNTWHIDNDDYVYAYDAAGGYLGKWKAKGLKYPEGIAVAGDDVLIVDRGYDKVFVYAGGAHWLDNANHYPSDSWSLDYSKGNRSPRGITTDGSTIWVVNNAWTDRIYQYSIDGDYQGRFNLDAGANNRNPRGIALSADGSELLVVDISSRRFYAYETNNPGAGSIASFALVSGNSKPQGIAWVIVPQ